MTSYLADHLSGFLLWIGIAVAFFGSVVVAPDAPLQLVRLSRQAIARFLRRPANVHVIAGSAVGIGSAVFVGFAESWDPNGTVDERIESLRNQVIDLRKQEISRRANELGDRIDALRTELAELRATFRASEEQSNNLDARCFLPIGLGILLSGAPEQLAHVPRLGVLLVIAGVIASIECLVVLCKHYAAAWRQRVARLAASSGPG